VSVSLALASLLAERGEQIAKTPAEHVIDVWINARAWRRQ
jgi:hypothetical protein